MEYTRLTAMTETVNSFVYVCRSLKMSLIIRKAFTSIPGPRRIVLRRQLYDDRFGNARGSRLFKFYFFGIIVCFQVDLTDTLEW